METAIVDERGPPLPAKRPAAFFGLDNTLIPGSSLLLLARGLQERDFYGRAQIMRLGWQSRMYRVGGRDGGRRVETPKQAALEFAQGRHRDELAALTREIAGECIVPQVYPDMARLIVEHRTSGVLTFVTTAAPVELAESVAEGLGMTGGIGTRAEIDRSERYSGRLAGSVLHGKDKAAAVEAHADATGIDLSASVAYSDTINDLPLLELVGRAEVVHPDRRLRKVAVEKGWTVHEPRPGPSRPPRPAPAPVSHRLAELNLQSPVVRWQETPASAGRNASFVVDDPEALVRELEASGRFRRDTRLGGVFHLGKTSLRELSPTHSLHITVEDDNVVSVHVDRYSPLAPGQRERRWQYSLVRIAAHNVTGAAGDITRLVARRRRPPASGSRRRSRDRRASE